MLQEGFVHARLLAAHGALFVVHPGGVRRMCVGSMVPSLVGRGGPGSGPLMGSIFTVIIHPSIHPGNKKVLYLSLYTFELVIFLAHCFPSMLDGSFRTNA